VKVSLIYFILGIAVGSGLLCAAACHLQEPRVEHIEQPSYPSAARFEDKQGTVRVKVSVDQDGKVISVQGQGADPVLVKASEENAAKWRFEPVGKAPIRKYEIAYIYRLIGKPKYVDAPPIINRLSPHRIEIGGAPLRSDYPPVGAANPDSH